MHADGEIWGQTLWDLRTALGSRTTEILVTRAMELSPANPSFLDERNAILQADLVGNGGANRDTIWKRLRPPRHGLLRRRSRRRRRHPGRGLPAAADGEEVRASSTASSPTTRHGPALAGRPSRSAATPPASPTTSSAADGKGGYDIKKILVGTYPDVCARPRGTTGP